MVMFDVVREFAAANSPLFHLGLLYLDFASPLLLHQRAPRPLLPALHVSVNLTRILEHTTLQQLHLNQRQVSSKSLWFEFLAE